jgi:hypothetical protein
MHPIGSSLSYGSGCLCALIGEVSLGSHLIILFEEAYHLLHH